MPASWPKSDLIVGLVLICLAGLYWIGAESIAVGGFSGTVSARALPHLLAIVLAVLAAVLVLQALLVRSVRPILTSTAREHLRAVGMLAFGIIFTLIVEGAGYPVAVGALLGAVALYLGAKPTWRLALFASVGALFLWALFAKILHIALPTGIL